MTNISLKFCRRKQQSGAATLLLTSLLLLTATLIVIFAAGYSLMQQKITSNQFRNQQAFEAAEAGLEYGISYLKQNRTTILANPVGGYLQNYTSASTTNVTMANGATYSIVYTNPTQNNYNLILVTSTGVSDDGTATRVVSQLVLYSSVLFAPGSNALVSRRAINMSGNSTITNTNQNSTILAGGALTMSGNGRTVTSSGTSSTPGNYQSDVQQNNGSISGLSVNDFFANFFGVPMSVVRAAANFTYSNSSSTNYSSTLNGKTGLIWIDQTAGNASLSGNTTVGTASNPVVLVVNGDFNISGNTTINGFVIVLGASSSTTDITGNVLFNGGLMTADAMNMSGNTNVTYNSTILTNLQSSTAFYAKVPGSWKDY